MSTVQEVKDIIERAESMQWGPACSAELAAQWCSSIP